MNRIMRWQSFCLDYLAVEYFRTWWMPRCPPSLKNTEQIVYIILGQEKNHLAFRICEKLLILSQLLQK